MQKTVLAGFDIGTSKLRCIIFNKNGSIIKSFDEKTPLIKKKDGYYNPVNNLYKLSLKVLKKTFDFANKNKLIVKGISISSVGEAGVIIDKKNKPLMDIIPWYDQRTSETKEKYLKKNISNIIYNNTGLNDDHFYSVYKILWIKKNYPKIYSKIFKWLPVNDYIAMKLTGNISTDYSQAMRTNLFDLKKLKWSNKMIKLFQIKPNILPEIINAGEKKGFINSQIKKYLSLNYDCVIGSGGHDHFVGVYGLGGFKNNTLVDSLGSAEAVTVSTNSIIKNKELKNSKFISGIFKTKHKVYNYLVGSILTSGLIINWFISNFNIKNYSELNKLLKKTGDKKILFFPQFEYSHTPINSKKSKGFITGIDRTTTKGDIYKSILEGLSFDTKHILNFLEIKTKIKISKIICSGGSVKNKEWIKIKSNILNKDIFIDERIENVSLGSAILAGLASGVYKNESDAFKNIKSSLLVIKKNNVRARYYKNVYKKYINSIKELNKINQIL